jgi:xanthine dehydrogenase molybdopterin-binding subunit B
MKPRRMKYQSDIIMTISSCNHTFCTKDKKGFSNHGLIQGIEMDFNFNCPWFLDIRVDFPKNVLLHSNSSYRIPNFALIVSLKNRNH